MYLHDLIQMTHLSMDTAVLVAWQFGSSQLQSPELCAVL
jgi:hypothetical protein